MVRTDKEVKLEIIEEQIKELKRIENKLKKISEVFRWIGDKEREDNG